MKIEVNITKKYFFTILSVLILLAGTFVVYAYNTEFNKQASQGVVSGNSADELVVKMSDGSLKTIQELLQNGVNSGSSSLSAAWVSTGRTELSVNNIGHFVTLEGARYEPTTLCTGAGYTYPAGECRCNLGNGKYYYGFTTYIPTGLTCKLWREEDHSCLPNEILCIK